MARTSRRTPRTQGERSAKGGVRLWQLRQGSGSAVSGLGRRAGQRSAPTRTLVGKKILKKQKRKSKNEGRVRRHSAGVGNPFHGAFFSPCLMTSPFLLRFCRASPGWLTSVHRLLPPGALLLGNGRGGARKHEFSCRELLAPCECLTPTLPLIERATKGGKCCCPLVALFMASLRRKPKGGQTPRSYNLSPRPRPILCQGGKEHAAVPASVVDRSHYAGRTFATARILAGLAISGPASPSLLSEKLCFGARHEWPIPFFSRCLLVCSVGVWGPR